MTLAAVAQPEYGIYLVPTHYCVDVWHEARDFLRPAIDRAGGRWTEEHVLSGLILGQQGLWVVRKPQEIIGAFTTEIVNYPAKRMLSVHFLGGEAIDEWYPNLSKTLVQYARNGGCAGIEINGRAGFWKWFKDDEFERVAVFYERKV